MILYHCTTPKKLRRYEISGCILAPVRGWKYQESAMEWSRRTGRDLILQVEVDKAYPLPDHKPKGHAYWADQDVTAWKIIKGSV